MTQVFPPKERVDQLDLQSQAWSITVINHSQARNSPELSLLVFGISTRIGRFYRSRLWLDCFGLVPLRLDRLGGLQLG